MSALPWFLPGVVLSIAFGLAASRPFARLLRVRQSIAWAILVGVGVIVSATLTPLRGTPEFHVAETGLCDFSRLGLATPDELLGVDDTSLNVLLFVPLGAALGMVRRSKAQAALIVAAISLPFAIETLQLLLPILDRGCQSADVVDNLSGLLIGSIIGTVLKCIGFESGAGSQ